MTYPKNLARKGPKKVWDDGYRNMRVPIAIFNDVKQFLERRKDEFLRGQEGIQIDDNDALSDEGTLAMSPQVQKHIPNMIQQIIREELSRFQETSPIGNISPLPERKKTAKEKIKELLIRHKNEELTTIQIGEILELPAPTCRQATRELADEDDTIEQYSGRPNKYKFNPH